MAAKPRTDIGACTTVIWRPGAFGRSFATGRFLVATASFRPSKSPAAPAFPPTCAAFGVKLTIPEVKATAPAANEGASSASAMPFTHASQSPSRSLVSMERRRPPHSSVSASISSISVGVSAMLEPGGPMLARLRRRGVRTRAGRLAGSDRRRDRCL